MAVTEQFQKTAGEMRLPLTAQEATEVRLNPVVIRPRQAVRPRSGINLSGSQLLVGFTSALGSAGLLLWALLRLWLFEP